MSKMKKNFSSYSKALQIKMPSQLKKNLTMRTNRIAAAGFIECSVEC